jgi:ribonuclease HI
MSLDIRLNALIVSDSQYVVGCMTTWIDKYRRNDWVNPAGREVANRDLLEEAIEVERELLQLGEVSYKWIPRVENLWADRYCNGKIDEA